MATRPAAGRRPRRCRERRRSAGARRTPPSPPLPRARSGGLPTATSPTLSRWTATCSTRTPCRPPKSGAPRSFRTWSGGERVWNHPCAGGRVGSAAGVGREGAGSGGEDALARLRRLADAHGDGCPLSRLPQVNGQSTRTGGGDGDETVTARRRGQHAIHAHTRLHTQRRIASTARLRRRWCAILSTRCPPRSDGGISSDDDDEYTVAPPPRCCARPSCCAPSSCSAGYRRSPPSAAGAAAVAPSSAPDHLLPPPRLAHDAHGSPTSCSCRRRRTSPRGGCRASAAGGGRRAGAAAPLADEVDALRLLPSCARPGSRRRATASTSAENMKAFFELLHNESAVSLAVHRVGNSLVLEGLELDDADASSAGSGSSTPTAAATAPRSSRKSIHDNFDVHARRRRRGGRRPRRRKRSTSATATRPTATTTATTTSARRMPPRRPPRGFRRVLRWQLDDLSLLLGSDTVVYRSEHAQALVARHVALERRLPSPGFSVKLHDENSSATSLVCLDYWLDNVMSNASDVALCLQKDGVVQGYRVVPTSGCRRPAASAAASRRRRSTAPCPSSASCASCTREAGTYWLVRRAGGRACSSISPSGARCRRRARRRHRRRRRRRRAGGGARRRPRRRPQQSGGGTRRADRAG